MSATCVASSKTKIFSVFRRMRNDAANDFAVREPQQEQWSTEASRAAHGRAASLYKRVVSADKPCARTCTKTSTQTCPMIRILLRNFGCNFQRTPHRQNAQLFLGLSAPPLGRHQPCDTAHAGYRPRPPNHGENHREAGVGTRLGKSTNRKPRAGQIQIND